MNGEPQEGVWFVYGMDWNAYPISVHPDELTARRAAMDNYGSVVYWPYGIEWSDLGGKS